MYVCEGERTCECASCEHVYSVYEEIIIRVINEEILIVMRASQQTMLYFDYDNSKLNSNGICSRIKHCSFSEWVT